MVTYLSLGSNLGEKLSNLKEAVKCLSKYGRIVRASSVYETEPVAETPQPMFLNCVLEYDFSSASPFELLKYIHKIEAYLGRKRGIRFGPRNIDIDILFFSNMLIDAPGIIIPHPRLAERLFVLVPLKEIAPFFIHPKEKVSITELYNRIYEGNYYCKKYADPLL
ncbi:MAG: 2-amino-4-hydroxy-6-hydroxymethyldihydropteridine diphosphokinase [bacterium]|nr:2-amino-4-hydroxy-6-hydroxymethyldihydropteridine diphosphokinase [bacterium]